MILVNIIADAIIEALPIIPQVCLPPFMPSPLKCGSLTPNPCQIGCYVVMSALKLVPYVTPYFRFSKFKHPANPLRDAGMWDNPC